MGLQPAARGCSLVHVVAVFVPGVAAWARVVADGGVWSRVPLAQQLDARSSALARSSAAVWPCSARSSATMASSYLGLSTASSCACKRVHRGYSEGHAHALNIARAAARRSCMSDASRCCLADSTRCCSSCCSCSSELTRASAAAVASSAAASCCCCTRCRCACCCCSAWCCWHCCSSTCCCCSSELTRASAAAWPCSAASRWSCCCRSRSEMVCRSHALSASSFAATLTNVANACCRATWFADNTTDCLRGCLTVSSASSCCIPSCITASTSMSAVRLCAAAFTSGVTAQSFGLGDKQSSPLQRLFF